MKVVIITSTGLSGAGAVSDYLLSREDFTSPFKNSTDYKQDYEFRMVTDPFGIDHLYKNFYNNFSINNAAYGYSKFLKYLDDLKRIKDTKTKKRIYNDFFFSEAKKYTIKIKKLSYFGLPQHFRISMTNFQKITWKFKNRKKDNYAQSLMLYEMVIPIEKKKFLKITKNFLLNVISQHDKTKKNNIVIDQGGNFWNPISSTKYFPNPKVIQITRDPKAIFSSMKIRKSLSYPGNDIKLFVKWYKEIHSKRNISEEKKVLQIKFEDFIFSHIKIVKKINNFLGLKNIKTNFNLENSKKNVYKFEKNLSKKEIQYINKELKKYVYI